MRLSQCTRQIGLRLNSWDKFVLNRQKCFSCCYFLALSLYIYSTHWMGVLYYILFALLLFFFHVVNNLQRAFVSASCLYWWAYLQCFQQFVHLIGLPLFCCCFRILAGKKHLHKLVSSFTIWSASNWIVFFFDSIEATSCRRRATKKQFIRGNFVSFKRWLWLIQTIGKCFKQFNLPSNH